MIARAGVMSVLAVLAAVMGTVPARAESLPFVADGLAKIEQGRAGRRFLAVLWSLDCAPCRAELALIGELRAAHPQLDVVLIATDQERARGAVDAVLAEHGLAAEESWIFADSNVEKLRYAIDPNWYGELPRAYLYERDSSRRGISGALTREVLTAWLHAGEDG